MSALEAEKKGALYGVLWALDADVKSCEGCRVGFNMLSRKHHCRFCGKIFCGSCSAHEMKHPKTSTVERACESCVSKFEAMGYDAKKSSGMLESVSASVSASVGIKEDSAAMGKKYGVRWREDEDRTACQSCHTPFDDLRRRHHCRHCGDLFCQQCSKSSIMHPLTNTPERSCKDCVFNQRVRQHTELELKSRRFQARLATVGVCLLTFVFGMAEHSGRAIFFGFIGAMLSASLLILRYQAISTGSSDEEVWRFVVTAVGMPFPGEEVPFEQSEDVGQQPESLGAEIASVIPFALDGILTILCFISAVSGNHGTHLIMILLAGSFGASAWYSYIDVAPSITQLMRRNGLTAGYSAVPASEADDHPQEELRL